MLLVTIDTLRADHLPLYGYQHVETPHLDALAKQAVVFERAAAHTPITLPSHTSILTGLYPPQHGVRNNGSFRAQAELVTMSERLEEVGYQTAAFVSAFVLDSRFGLDQGFAHYDDDLVGGRRRFSLFSVRERRAEVTVDRVLDWWAAHAADHRPFFVWAHLYDPHFSYDPPEPFRSRYEHPYDGEIAYTDQQVGRLLAALRRSDQYDNTLVIVTSDHGESLGEHRERTHSLFVYEATQWVPLLMRLPHGQHGGQRVTGLARHIDILPTVMDLLDLDKAPRKLAREIHGESLVPSMSGSGKTLASGSYAEAYLPLDQFGWSALYGWRNERYKFIEAPSAELYDLENDPGELDNLIGMRAEKARALRRELRSLRQKLTSVVEGARAPLDDETITKLESLGYFAGSEPAETERGRDPKEMIHVYEAREEARRLVDDGAPDRAIAILRSALSEDASNAATHNDLGAIFAERGAWREAAEHYRRATELAPERTGPYIGLAKVYFKGLGDFAAAEVEINTASSLDPHDPSIWTLRGDFLHAQKRMKKAVAAYQRAVDGGSKDASLFVGYASALTNLGRYDAARRMVDEALRIDADNAIAHYNRGVILVQLGEVEGAEAAYREALRLRPTNLLAYENLGQLLISLGREKEAEMVFAAGLEVDSGAPALLYQQGSLYVRAGLLDHGIRLLEQAVAITPNAAPVRTNLGFAYHRQGRFDEAFVQYEALTRIYSEEHIGYADAWLRMANVRAQQGALDEANELLETALIVGGDPIRNAIRNHPDLLVLPNARIGR